MRFDGTYNTMQYNCASFTVHFNKNKSCTRARHATVLVIVGYYENRWVFNFDLNWAKDMHWRTENIAHFPRAML